MSQSHEPRYRIPMSLEYVCPERDLPGKGEVRDISASGMYVEEPGYNLDVGDYIRAPLWLLATPGIRGGIFVEGRVVRADAGGFAVRFERMDPDIGELLRRVLQIAEERERSHRSTSRP